MKTKWKEWEGYSENLTEKGINRKTEREKREGENMENNCYLQNELESTEKMNKICA